MKFKFGVVIVLVASIFLSGCATLVYLEEKPVSDDYGKVTVIREYAEPTAFRIKVLVDGELAAVIKNKSYVTFSLPAGDHKLKFDWPATGSDTELEFDFKLNGLEYKYYNISQIINLNICLLVIKTSEYLQVREYSIDDGKKVIKSIKNP